MAKQSDQQKQFVAKLQDAQNVLVTVSKNPTVDQLAAAIGLTLALAKLNKHAAAVYSGETPSVLEFLHPAETLETNTDSLRDFIIALDKSKADKLRYKVEDEMVRIFITPYRTSISESDLEFSQGDFNVDAVVTLGVQEQSDLDSAVQMHGRILHDATVLSMSLDSQPAIGTIAMTDPDASSLCEMISDVLQQMDKDVFDEQIATALLTGIVATTERFSNEHTKASTMTVSALLMAAGADQQLVAVQLESLGNRDSDVDTDSNDDNNTVGEVGDIKQVDDPGTLAIKHDRASEKYGDHEATSVKPDDLFSAGVQSTYPTVGETDDSDDNADIEQNVDLESRSVSEQETFTNPQVQVDDDGRLVASDPTDSSIKDGVDEAKDHPAITQVRSRPLSEQARTGSYNEPRTQRERIVTPPSTGGMLTANTLEEGYGPTTEELVLPSMSMPILDHGASGARQVATVEELPPSPPADTVFVGSQVSNESTSRVNDDIVSRLPGLSQSQTPPVSAGSLQPPDLMPMPPRVETVDPVGSPLVTQKPPSLEPSIQAQPLQTEGVIDTNRQTLSDIENVIASPHVTDRGVESTQDIQAKAGGYDANLDDARSAVNAVFAGQAPANSLQNQIQTPLGQFVPPAQLNAPATTGVQPVVDARSSQGPADLPPPPPLPPPPIFPAT